MIVMYKIKTYLTGPITLRNNNECREWRNIVTERLREFKIQSLNPFNIRGNTDTIREKIYKSNQLGDVETTRNLVNTHMIETDLKMVIESDFLTVWIPKRLPNDFDFHYLRCVSDDSIEMEDFILKNIYEICGSYGEVTLAKYLGKPIYVVTERSIKPMELPSWLVGCSTKIFISWEDYYRYIMVKYYMVKI